MKHPIRYKRFLGERYRLIFGYTGLISIIIGGVILSPLISLVFYPGEVGLVGGFLCPGLIMIFTGALLRFFLAPREVPGLTLQEGTVIVALSWLLAVLAGAVPFILINGLDFTQAVFEATSGWTTTGLSVVDVTRSSHLILLYRSIIQLAGGAGLAIIMLSALAGPSGTGLSAAEGRTEQLAPHVRKSAKLVLTIYTGYAVVGVPALRLAGMSWFDAVNHAFAALSTGGFSTRADSIGYWNSPVVEAVVIVLMLAGNLNFLTSYTLFTGKFKAVARNGEIRLQAFLIPVCALAIFFGVTAGLYPTLSKAVRVAIFETVSALTTTGFSTVSYQSWGSLGWLLITVLMIIGGGTGSTAGGIKQYRVYVLYKAVLWEFRRLLQPRNIVNGPYVWQGETKQYLTESGTAKIALFVFLYIAAFFIGSSVITAYGYPFKESLFEFASSLGTVGLSSGITAPNAPAGVLWTEISGMLLGRLEFFSIAVGLVKFFRDICAIGL